MAGEHTRVMTESRHTLTAILPCTNVAQSRAFYARLGFTNASGDEEYLMLSDGLGGEIHLQPSVPGCLVPGKNPFGFYLYTEQVDELAAVFGAEILEKGKRPEEKPWGMYEFSLSDPDETLVRIGWPTRLRSTKQS